jgi:hypothetical protein
MADAKTAPKQSGARTKSPSVALIKFLGSIFVAGRGKLTAPELRFREIDTALGSDLQWRSAESTGLVVCRASEVLEGRHVELTPAGEKLLGEWIELNLF